MTAEMEFCVLGPLLVRRDGIALPTMPGKLRVLLAALLLSANRLVPLDELSAAMWGDDPPASARVTLRNYVKELRQALGTSGRARICTSPGGYLIRAAAGELDSSRFEALCGRARQAAEGGHWAEAVALLESATALWRGEPLADVRSERLALREAGRLAELRLQAIEARIDAELQLGRHADAIADLRQLVALHPLRERLHALLMLASYRDGQQAAALAGYQRAREVLVAELGVEPGPELRRLQQQILTADPTLAMPVSGPRRVPGDPRPVAARPLMQLPADLSDFTGRAEQTSLLAASLRAGPDGGRAAGAVVISVLTGPGGIGKTSLAVHVAHMVAAQFPDGQIFLNLRGSSREPVTVAEALARLLRDLGGDPSAGPADEGELAARFRSLTAGRRLMLVLDDARDAANVRPLLPGAEGCAVLVTSRRSLADLESAGQVDLGILADQDADALFSRIAGPARTEAEPEATRRVLAACGGLPLAIRIAAARLAARPGWSITALADRLADAQRRLDVLQTGDLAVRTSFLASYVSLRPLAPRLGVAPDRAFRLLGLAEGPDISPPAAAALFGVPVDQAEQAMETLVDGHLLQAPSTARYRFHDLLRVYAAERVIAEEPAPARDDAVRRMLQWYLHTAARACRVVNPHRPHVTVARDEPAVVPLAFDSYSDALSWLDAEHINLLCAVDQAARRGEHEIAWQLPHILWDLFNLRGHIGDWLGAHRSGLASARLLGDVEAEKRMLGGLAGNYVYLGQPTAALDCIGQILAIARGLGDTGGTAVALVNLGASLTQLGRADEAMAHLQEALGLFREIGELNGEAHALCAIAAVNGLRGAVPDAVSGYRAGLTILKEINNLASAAESLVELCHLRLKLGQPDPVVHEAAEAVELSRLAGSRRVEAEALMVLGQAHRDRDQPGRAHQCWRDALAICTQIGHPQAASLRADLHALEAARPG